MSMMPDEYEYDYLVFSASNSITEEEAIWNMRFSEVYKRMTFRKFDSFVEQSLMEWYKDRPQE